MRYGSTDLPIFIGENATFKIQKITKTHKYLVDFFRGRTSDIDFLAKNNNDKSFGKVIYAIRISFYKKVHI